LCAGAHPCEGAIERPEIIGQDNACRRHERCRQINWSKRTSAYPLGSSRDKLQGFNEPAKRCRIVRAKSLERCHNDGCVASLLERFRHLIGTTARNRAALARYGMLFWARRRRSPWRSALTSVAQSTPLSPSAWRPMFLVVRSSELPEVLTSLGRYRTPANRTKAKQLPWADFITTMVGFEVFGTYRRRTILREME
jgi:hypothetical protein